MTKNRCVLFPSNFILIITIASGLIFVIGSAQGEKTLVLSQILFRHGVRSPTGPYPNDPFKDESNWPDGWGQLTELGKLGQYELGEFLRNRYDGFLSQKFKATEVHMVSSDYDRNILSSQALLSGLYKADGNETPKANSISDVQWGLFPVHTIPAEYDTLLQPKLYNSKIKNVKKCPRYEALYKEVLQSERVLKHIEDNLELYELVRDKSAYPMKSLVNGAGVIGIISIQKLYNFSIPEWSRDILSSPEKMRVMTFGFDVLSLTDEMKRLSAGPLLSKFLENIQNKIENKETRKMYLYAGHDMILANMLDTLGIWNGIWVDFSFAIILDLYVETGTSKNEQNYFIEISYRNDTSVEPYKMQVPGCPNPCEVQNFIKLMEPFIPDDLEEECQSQSTANTAGSGFGVKISEILTIFLCIFIYISTG